MLEIEIIKIDVSTGKIQKIADQVAEDKVLHIFINRTHYASIYCSPSNLKELAVGHLLSEGIVKSIEEIEEIDLKDEGLCRIKLKANVNVEGRLKHLRLFSRVITSACGGQVPHQFSKKIPKVNSNLTVKAEAILNGVNHLNHLAETFRRTGGVHASAIYKGNGDVVAFAEDVGRHNTVDKVIGIGAFKKIDFGECFLTLSGRLSGDVVLKAARVGLPIVASLAAALNSGIAIAKNADLTLIGFVRGKRMNIYNFPERIILN